MKRLTYKNKSMKRFEVMENIDTNYLKIRSLENGVDTLYTGKIINRLAEYENTGLEPKEIERLKRENEKLNKENGYIIFADGYDENNKEVNKQVYVTYKQRCNDYKIVIAKLKANFDEQAVHLQEEKQTAIKKLVNDLQQHIEKYGWEDSTINDFAKVRGIELYKTNLCEETRSKIFCDSAQKKKV